MRMMIKVIGLVLAVLAGTARADAPKLDLKRTMVIDGVIMGGNLGKVQDAMDNFAKSADKSPVHLIINSPGGSVTSGFLFLNHVNAMKAQGIELRCYVPDVAASMAFQILLHCDKRFVLTRSFLLWHRVRVSSGGLFGSPITAPQAKYLAITLQKLDTFIFREVTEAMSEVSRSVLRYHFENETLHLGYDVASMAPRAFQSYDYIPGLFDALKNDKLPRTEQLFFFGRANSEEIIYQTTKVDYVEDNN
jgi:ATP-dependent protease ClpP protease subunit